MRATKPATSGLRSRADAGPSGCPSTRGGSDTTSTFVLSRLDDGTWLIQDPSFPSDDARHVVACVHDAGEIEVEVVWVRPTSLPTRYATAADVLDDLLRRMNGGRAAPPVPIPRFAPVRG